VGDERRGGEHFGTTAALTWHPDPTQPSVPSGAHARITANIAAIHTLRTVQAEARPATRTEQERLSRWSSWGAVPGVFDESNTEFTAARGQLRELLSEREFNAASRTTINAHYTDPAIVAAMWLGLQGLGFDGGAVLEPGSGSGTFLGLAPATATLTGVELDPTTAAIAGYLYPEATIRAESFADTRLPAAHFDAVIGNVPFANVTLTDPVHNQGHHSMHNHFVLKSLALTKPGGTVMVLTSRYTLDAQNPAARREIAGQAQLLGAVRLPTGAHQRTAGTQVVTDLLVLRRRDGTVTGPDADWERAEPMAGLGGGEPLRVNQYFHEHPRQILGTLSTDVGRFHSPDLRVTHNGPLGPALSTALAPVLEQARARGLVHHPREPDPTERRLAARVGGDSDRMVGHISEDGDATFTVRTPEGTDTTLAVPTTQTRELSQLLRLRDTEVALLTAEAATGEDTENLASLRHTLTQGYDRYTETYGPINRVARRRTGRTDPATGDEVMAEIAPPVIRLFGSDPFAAMVRALETYDAATGTATKAAIHTTRVVAPRQPRLGADTPADAVAICLDTHGALHGAEIARLLGVSEPAARQAMGQLVYDDPRTGQLVTAADYLSGNVRAKLVDARAAAATEERFAVNVTALAEVIPEDLGPGDIDARLGAAWVDAEDVQDFLRETLADATIRVTHSTGSDWTVRGGNGGVLATEEWGTERKPAPRLAQHQLKQQDIRIYDEMEDGTRICNPTETTAANDKATALNDRFAEWVWEDPARADRLARVYNDRFNALVLRSYDTTHMSLPGLARTFTPHPHQLAAVARIIAEPNTGLFHAVGAGKTAEMAMGVMELRRLNLVNKPALVVPNHMLRQFSTEFLQLYPQARVNSAGIEALAGDKRRDFVARVTTGDWDAVIMTRTAFSRLPVATATRQAYLEAEITPMREAAARLRAEGEPAATVKRVENQILAAEERIKSKLGGPVDPGITFEHTGIDLLVVDELHDYKNLFTPSNIRDAAITGADRASDLHLKVDYLRNRHGGRALIGATATPIANSITEAYVMQRYLRPDLLAEAGIGDFDTWAATFGSTVSALEMSPDGGSWRMKTRFAKFRNTPELLRMWHVGADVKTAEELKLPVPRLAARGDGQRAPQTIVVAPSDQVRAYVAELGQRAEAVRNGQVEPQEDNMLSITSDGRAAALDLRLIRTRHGEEILEVDPGAPGKSAAAAECIARIWNDNAQRSYLAVDGAVHPRTGALQLVFADLGTPGEHWNVYDNLRAELVDRGVPPGQVAFIHHARTDRDKEALFEAARTGQVQVLIGSTKKMGVGTNVQDRAVALHHLDCPWRPADLAQRDGRILRQGNQNPEVGIYRYVTEATFDTYSWQTVERKAAFIAQVTKGRLDTREIDDLGGDALSYAEVKALASGDPTLLEKATVDAEVSQLERLRRAHDRGQAMLRHRVSATTSTLAALNTEVPTLAAAIERRVSTKGDVFTATVNGARYTERGSAAAALAAPLSTALANDRGYYRHELGNIGTLGGFTLTAATVPTQQGTHAILSFPDCPARAVTFTAADLRQAGPGIIVRLENSLTALDRALANTRAAITATTDERDRAQARLGMPFDKADQLAAARTHQQEITARMTAAQDPPAATVDQAAGAPTAGWRAALGTRPTEPARAEHWDAVVSMVDAYRSTYAITDPARALGPTPDPASERAAAHRSITREWTTATSGEPALEPSSSVTAAAASPALTHNATGPNETPTATRRIDVDGITDDSGYGYQQSYTDRHRTSVRGFKTGY